jgi:hypothetical protein
MPKQTHRIETDKGTFEVEVDAPDPTMKPVDSNEPDTYWGGFAKGAKEGMVGGAEGFAKGIVPGAYHGAVNSLMAIPALAKGLLGTAVGTKNLIADPEKTLREAAESMKGIPGKASEAIDSAMKLAAQDPEAFGKAVGDVTGQTMVGIAGARALPLAPKPLARAAGKLAEQIGTKGAWPIRMMGAHQLGSGDPLGLLTMAMPGGLKSGGEALQKFGGADTAKTLPSGARELDFGNVKSPGIRLAAEKPGIKPSSGRVPLTGAPAEASGRVQKVVAKEGAESAKASAASAKVQANADRLATIDKATEGLEAGKPSISKSVSAETPEGGRKSMRQTFRAPEEAAAAGDDSLEALMRAQGLDPSKMVSASPVVKPSTADRVAPRTMPAGPSPVSSAPAMNPMEAQLAGAPEEVDLTGAMNRMGERRPQVTNAAGRPLLSETGGPAPAATPAPPGISIAGLEAPAEVDLTSMLGDSPVRRPQVTNAAGRPFVSEQSGPLAPVRTPAPSPMAAAMDAGPEEVDLTSMLNKSDMPRRANVTSASGRPLLSETGGADLSPMEAQLMSTSSPKLPIEGNLPASKSRTTPMSNTPGLTLEDMKTLGLNPDMKVTGLAPESIERVLAERAKRAAIYRSNAGLDAGAKRALELDEVPY